MIMLGDRRDNSQSADDEDSYSEAEEDEFPF
jgi:hypothetical protein